MKGLFKLYEVIGTPIFILDQNLDKFIFINEAFEDLSGHSREKLESIGLPIMFNEVDTLRINNFLAIANEKQRFEEFNLTFKKRSKRELKVNLYADVIFYQEKKYFVFTVYDVTQLRKLLQDLEGEVAKRTQELDRKNMALQKEERRSKEAHRELENFREELQKNERLALVGEIAGNISHELSNPLAILNMTCETLIKKVKSIEANNKEIDELTKKFHTVFSRVAELTNKFRQLAIKQPKIDLAVISLDRVLDSSCALFQNTLKKKQVQLHIKEYEKGIFISTDENRASHGILKIFELAIEEKRSKFALQVEVENLPEAVNIIISSNQKNYNQQEIEQIFQPHISTSNKVSNWYIIKRIMSSISCNIFFPKNSDFFCCGLSFPRLIVKKEEK